MTDNDQLTELGRIRGLMDRSTRFLSLSGLSGIIAGVAALGGAFAAREHHQRILMDDRAWRYGSPVFPFDPMGEPSEWWDHITFLLADATLVLFVAVLGAFWFTWRRSKQMGQSLWDASARRMLVNLLIPLFAGGVFAIALLFHGELLLVPAATLVFYGLALVNASKYTLDEVRWLGISEIILGLIASFWVGAGLLFWALGFGVLHIFYGGLMYLRYERGARAEAE